MTVSHYLVSWIQVAGLILGLYGFFFLSISVFGMKSLPWFRALLPATGIGLGVALAGVMLHDARTLDSLTLWIFALVFFLLAYIVAIYSSLHLSRAILEDHGLFSRFLINTAVSSTIVITIAIGVDVARYLNGATFAAARADYWATLAGSVLISWMIPAIIWLPRILNESRLQKLGFFLSVLAILTQFIPPVLDVLNITITK